MIDTPLISVIIPAYNAADSIAAAIESALAQTYRPLEIIVVDDGSVDATLPAARAFGDQVVVLQQQNAGPAAARNAGLRHSRGAFIAFLDADDRWLPEKLARQWAVLSQQPEIGLVHTDVEFFDPISQRQWQRDVGRETFVGKCTDRLLEENRILTSSVVVRREQLEAVGFFDEQFKGVEDYDLWLRMSCVCEFAYVDQPLVTYRLQQGSLSSHSGPMREGELRVVQKALASTWCRSSSGGEVPARPQRIRSRLRALNWDIGYDAFQKGNFHAARRFLGESLRFRPFSLYAAMLWCSTWFPPPIIGWLQRRKEQLTAKSRSSMQSH